MTSYSSDNAIKNAFKSVIVIFHKFLYIFSIIYRYIMSSIILLYNFKLFNYALFPKCLLVQSLKVHQKCAIEEFEFGSKVQIIHVTMNIEKYMTSLKYLTGSKIIPCTPLVRKSPIKRCYG